MSRKKSWYTSIQTLFKNVSINEKYALNLKTKFGNYKCKRCNQIRLNMAKLNDDFGGNKLYGKKRRTYGLFEHRFCLKK